MGGKLEFGAYLIFVLGRARTAMDLTTVQSWSEECLQGVRLTTGVGNLLEGGLTLADRNMMISVGQKREARSRGLSADAEGAVWMSSCHAAGLRGDGQDGSCVKMGSGYAHGCRGR